MSVVKFPVATEKAIRMMESENKLVFVVDRDASKPQIKADVEKLFKAKVVKINTLISHRTGKKQAIVKLSQATPAIDIATDLGLM